LVWYCLMVIIEGSGEWRELGSSSLSIGNHRLR
jgi:hypothetical protein